jgi:PilZ domain
MDAARKTAQNIHQSERRRHKRVELVLPARFMLPDRSEHEATVLNISAGGIALATAERPPKGASVIVYVKEIGRLEGMVVRHVAKGFALVFDIKQVQRDRIMEKITLHMNRAHAGNIDVREHVRMASDEEAKLILQDGSVVACRVLDMSFGGVSLAIKINPPLGERVMIGRMRGRVVRHHEHGIGVAFDDMPSSWGSLSQGLRHKPGA